VQRLPCGPCLELSSKVDCRSTARCGQFGEKACFKVSELRPIASGDHDVCEVDCRALNPVGLSALIYADCSISIVSSRTGSDGPQRQRSFLCALLVLWCVRLDGCEYERSLLDIEHQIQERNSDSGRSCAAVAPVPSPNEI
jgi:hypothetical protein